MACLSIPALAVPAPFDPDEAGEEAGGRVGEEEAPRNLLPQTPAPVETIRIVHRGGT